MCATAVAATSASAPAEEPQSLARTSVGASVDTFYRSFSSPDETARDKADLYLLGVMDLTEGRVWCEYRRFKTVTLREVVGEYIRKLPQHRFNERAAVVIEEALKSALPCRAQKK